MRTLAAALVLLLCLAGCRSTYHARADDLARAAGPGATVPALDDDGDEVSLRVASILATAPPDATGRQEVRAADGRISKAVGWTIFGLGLASGVALASGGGWGSDVSTFGLWMGISVATPLMLISSPFLTYGYAVGSPEE